MANLHVDGWGSPLGTTLDFWDAVALYLIPGADRLDKYGENPTIDTTSDPEDIWEGGGLYPFSDTGVADIVSVSSSDDTDTQLISVEGLDINGNEVIQTVTLAGQTTVALDPPLWRFYRSSNEASEGNDFAGTIYIYSGTDQTLGVPDGASVVKGIMENGNNQTLMAIYTVPRGKVGFLVRGEIGMSRALTLGAARCAYYSRRYGKVFKVKKRVDVTASGTSTYQDRRSFPDIVPALTDIKLTVESVTGNDTGVFGTFDLCLIDEEKFTDVFLAKIGQPT